MGRAQRCGTVRSWPPCGLAEVRSGPSQAASSLRHPGQSLLPPSAADRPAAEGGSRCFGTPLPAGFTLNNPFRSAMLSPREKANSYELFEEKAAVTELLLCASANEPSSFRFRKSPCAERYLARTLEIVQPHVVIAVVFWRAQTSGGILQRAHWSSDRGDDASEGIAWKRPGAEGPKPAAYD